MSCEDIRNLALLSACGEAGEAEAASVREHAAKCPACAGEIRALHEGLELLKHMPREAPSREARAQIGSMLLREAPRPASRSVRGWAIAAAALMAVTASALAWKLGAWETRSPTRIARDGEEKTIRPVPVVEPGPKMPAPPKRTADEILASFSAEQDDLDDLSSALSDLRGGKTTASVRPDPSAVWYGQNSTAVDALYESLDEITASPDKF